MAAWRRYVIKPERLNTFADDGIVLLFLFALLFTGFLIEGLRIGATELNPASTLYDTSAAAWSPVGWVFAKVLDVQLPDPFPRITYAESMNRFGKSISPITRRGT